MQLLTSSERTGRVPPGETFGDRFVNSELYTRLSEDGGFSSVTPLRFLSSTRDVPPSVRLLETREFMAQLQEHTSSQPFKQRARNAAVTIEPAPTRVPGLVESVPVSAGKVHLVTETERDDGAGGFVDGWEAPNVRIVLEGEDASLHSWGAHMIVPRQTLQDAGQARSLSNRFLREVATLQLEVDMLVGDGSEANGVKRLSGITTTTGIGAVERDAAGNEPISFALARAVRTIQDAGHYDGSISVVATPGDLERLFTDADADGNVIAWRDVLPSIERFVPTLALPAETFLVGNFFAGAALYLDSDQGFSLDLSDTHKSGFVERLTTLRLANDLLFQVRQADAFCTMTEPAA